MLQVDTKYQGEIKVFIASLPDRKFRAVSVAAVGIGCGPKSKDSLLPEEKFWRT